MISFLNNLDISLFRWLNALAGVSASRDFVVVALATYLPYTLGVVFVCMLIFWGESLGRKMRLIIDTAASVVLSRFILTPLIRFFIYRARPFLALPGVHNLLASHNAGSSFPSGHAAFFFALAVSVCFYDGRWGAIFFVSAVLITISRVIAGVHYPGDIAAGFIVAVCAACVAHMAVKRMKIIE